jgi:hypothetical protein
VPLVSSNAPGCKFDTIGARRGGRVVEDGREVQQRDLAGVPMTWPDSGKPKMQYVVTVDTGQIDPNIPGDDGHRSLFFSGQRLHRLKEVLRARRAGDVKVGGRVYVTYTHDKPSSTGGFPQKIYDVEYESPVAGAVVEGAGQPSAAPANARQDARAAVVGVPPGVDPAVYARVQAEVLARIAGTAKPGDEPPF